MPLATEKIGLQLTTKCDMTCAHCLISCRPGKGHTFDPGKAEELIDSAAEAGVRFMTITGGEPMEEEQVLASVLGAAATTQIKTSVVTNAGWARDPQKLRTTVDMLADFRISSLEVSYDYYHSRFVGFATIEGLIHAAQSRGISLRLLCGLTRDPRTFDTFRFISSLPVDVIYFPVQPIGRAAKIRRGLLVSDRLENGVCPQAGEPFVLSDGRVLFCCGLAPFADDPLFDDSAALLGNLADRRLDRIFSSTLPVHEAVMSNPVSMLVQEAVIRGGSVRPGVCESCYALLKNPDKLPEKTDDVRMADPSCVVPESSCGEGECSSNNNPLPFGILLKANTPVVLAKNALSRWDDLEGSIDRSPRLIGYLDNDGRVSYRFVGESVAAVVEEMLDGGTVLLEDPDEVLEDCEVPDINEYFRRASVVRGFEQGIFLARLSQAGSTPSANSRQEDHEEVPTKGQRAD